MTATERHMISLLRATLTSRAAYEGKKVDSAKFKAFYQYLLSAYAEQTTLTILQAINKFIAGVTYDQ